MLKIQARRVDQPDEPTDWTDTEETPQFSTRKEAETWLLANTNAAELMQSGWEFQIVEDES